MSQRTRLAINKIVYDTIVNAVNIYIYINIKVDFFNTGSFIVRVLFLKVNKTL